MMSNQNQNTIIPVIGAMVHIYTSHGGNVTQTIGLIKEFLDNTPVPTIFVGPPSFQLDITPIKYKNSTII